MLGPQFTSLFQCRAKNKAALYSNWPFLIHSLILKLALKLSLNYFHHQMRISDTQVKCGFYASLPAQATNCTMQTHLWQYLCGVGSLSDCLSDYQSTIFIKIIK